MSEVYTEVPPAENGCYWIYKIGKDYGWRIMERQGTTPYWTLEDGLRLTDAQMIDWKFRFGPKIPSPEELSQMQADLARFNWLLSTVLQSWPRERIDQQIESDKKYFEETWNIYE